ncbi:hypothetical protein PGTUg99_018384 [Puccinia graminis f. sp. tritici]|uniref:Cutinase n=1 Tax=Puccinia graminis f. sp. tritici TaxID=56615 RepID=A0A5B0SJU7_PUCGR|nr:hypothetical protein PGTUg99_018384 [Puccinia graminis f. sp. tritici]
MCIHSFARRNRDPCFFHNVSMPTPPNIKASLSQLVLYAVTKSTLTIYDINQETLLDMQSFLTPSPSPMECVIKQSTNQTIRAEGIKTIRRRFDFSKLKGGGGGGFKMPSMGGGSDGGSGGGLGGLAGLSGGLGGKSDASGGDSDSDSGGGGGFASMFGGGSGSSGGMGGLSSLMGGMGGGSGGLSSLMGGMGGGSGGLSSMMGGMGGGSGGLSSMMGGMGGGSSGGLSSLMGGMGGGGGDDSSSTPASDSVSTTQSESSGAKEKGPATPVVTPAGCKAYRIIGARGTTEGASGSMAYNQLVQKILAAVPGGAKEELQYSTSADYSVTVTQGAQTEMKMITTELAKCPKTLYVLLGYSKGCMVQTQVLSSKKVPSANVGAVVFFGNPYFKGGAAQNKCSAKSGSGIAGMMRPTLPADITDRVYDCCTTGDMICQSTGSIMSHLTYGSKATEAAAFVTKSLNAKGIK